MDVLTAEESAEIQLSAQAELEPGERLLWSGRPSTKGKIENPLALLPLVLFGLFFGGFAAFWIWMAAGRQLPHLPRPGQPQDWFRLFFPLFGFLPLFVGLGMVTSPAWLFVAGKWLAKRTIYAVTDRRVLVMTRAWNRVVTSWSRKDIGGELTKVERGDGTGDLIFSRLAPGLEDLSTGRRAARRTPGLYGLSDVNAVERLLR